MFHFCVVLFSFSIIIIYEQLRPVSSVRIAPLKTSPITRSIGAIGRASSERRNSFLKEYLELMKFLSKYL
jgi:hypothetical protein